MLANKLLSVSILLLVLLPLSYSALIKGTVYNYELEKVEALVTINTTPVQKKVAVEGHYSYEVRPGSYTITASRYTGQESMARENITIRDEGNYTLDIILFPVIEELEMLDEFDDYPEVEKDNLPLTYITLLVASALAIVGASIIIKRRYKIQEKDVAEDIIDFIRQEEGRATQKEIRKNFPMSESKISLILAELEKSKRIKRFKRGRSNIVRLSK